MTRRRRLAARHESWPTRGSFTISRGAVTAVELVVVEVAEDGAVGRGECRPYPRYGESVEQTLAAMEGVRPLLEGGGGRAELAGAVGSGAARNALDCALWDLEAKRAGTPAWRLAGLPEPRPLEVSYTLSLGAPAGMAAAAREAGRPLLKLKLGGAGDLERVVAVRAAAPGARLIVDANEAWTPDLYAELAPALAGLGVELIEQPFPADRDAWLDGLERPVPLCADESCHDAASLEPLAGRYDLVNLKLDKTGGLTEARRAAMRAQELGLGVMVGCMVATSLAMAPAVLLAQLGRWCDLDGPLLLERDRDPGLVYRGALVEPPSPALGADAQPSRLRRVVPPGPASVGSPAMRPDQLSHELREGGGGDLERRRWIVGLSLVGVAMGAVVGLYQTGVLRRLPSLPSALFDAGRVDASDYAYSRLQTPDGLLMIASYAFTAILAGAGGRDRARDHPVLPLALAAKTLYDSYVAIKLGREEWRDNEALCDYCQTATLASLASAGLALPEAMEAARTLLDGDARS